MSVRIGNRVFAPRPWAVLATAAVLAGFVSLGYWQLGRARAKQALIEAFIAGNQTSVDATGLGFDEVARYQHVHLRGAYDATRQILLDNMPSTRTGRPGFRVLTPLERSDGKGWVLVDRGWVPLGATREALPDVSVGGDERMVRGRLDRLPVPGVRLGPAAPPGTEAWPRVMNFPLEADVEAALGAAVESRIVLLDPDLPEGYEREWRPALGFGPERHLGYAIQWFAAAIAAAVIFIALSLRRAAPAGEASSP
jgi:surfeit locus 1 family protein